MAPVANHLVALSSTVSADGSGPSPVVVGALVLGILLAVLLAVITIGGGREHS